MVSLRPIYLLVLFGEGDRLRLELKMLRSAEEEVVGVGEVVLACVWSCVCFFGDERGVVAYVTDWEACIQLKEEEVFWVLFLMVGDLVLYTVLYLIHCLTLDF